MVDVYLYIPAERAEDAVQCGLKLSVWSSRETEIGGEKKKCIRTLLNPRDDMEKYTSPAYRCLRLQVRPRYCFAADSLLYEAGVNVPEAMELYKRSIIHVEDYIFGVYRAPECLVTCTVSAEEVHLLGKTMDAPVLFTNSEELYFSIILEELKDRHNDLNDALFYHFYSRLCGENKMSRIEDAASQLAVFTDLRSGRSFTLRIPDMDGY